jgi:hypothetical protein
MVGDAFNEDNANGLVFARWPPEYDLLFRWFLDLNVLAQVWDHSTFSENQDRLLAHRTADLFFARVVELAREQAWVSDAHFTVDGTLIDAWASLKSFQPKDGPKNGSDGDPGNPGVDFHGDKRSNARTRAPPPPGSSPGISTRPTTCPKPSESTKAITILQLAQHGAGGDRLKAGRRILRCARGGGKRS